MLVYSKYVGKKKEKKYQHFNIFDYTYLPKTDTCLFFFLFFFYEPFPKVLLLFRTQVRGVTGAFGKKTIEIFFHGSS